MCHVHGPDTDEPLLTYEPGSASGPGGAGLTDKRYLHADERGSIVAISNASGQVTQINAYDDYGIPQGKNAGGAVITDGTGLVTANFGRFGYTGQVWLPYLGLSYYKARMYSPTLGRFMQTDPIGYGDGVNLYAYVGGDPVNFSDPLGLNSIDVRNARKRVEPVVTRLETKGICDGCTETVTAQIITRVTFQNGDPFGGGNGNGGEKGAGDGKGMPMPDCPTRDVTGMCDSSGDPKASAKKLQKEQCARIAQMSNAFGSVNDAANVASPAAFSKTLLGKIVGRIGFLISIPNIAASLGKLINKANGTPCK